MRRVKIHALTALATVATLVAAPQPAPQPLARVKMITADQARQHEEVFTSGVVTYTTEPRLGLFIQDGTSSIFVRDKLATYVSVGDEVRVRGRITPGGYAPLIEAAEVEIVGRKRSLPPEVPVELPDLLVGNHHCSRVKIEGRLRSVESLQGKPYLRLEQHGHLIRVRMNSLNRDNARAWLGRRLRVTGVAASTFNRFGQMTDVLLYAGSDAEVALVAGQRDEWPPLTPIGRILTYDSNRHRTAAVHVSGRITYSRDGRLHVIQDSTGGITVESAAPEHLPLGSAIEVNGYAKFGDLSPTITDAVFTPIPAADAVTPLPMNPLDLVAGALEARLVTLEGTLLSTSQDSTGGVFLRFQTGGREYSAQLDKLPPDANLAPGTRFAVTGVSVLTRNAYTDTSYRWFRLQLRSLADLSVVASPPFWNSERGLAFLLIGICVAGAIWIVRLRRGLETRAVPVRQSEPALSIPWSQAEKLERVAEKSPIAK